MDIKDLKKALEDAFKLSVTDTRIVLEEIDLGRYKISGNYISKALNILRGNGEEVNVVKWFNDFWIYFEVNIIQSKQKDLTIFLSLSIFNGKEDDNAKIQLFRAEWDNYEDNLIHPQPHWHILTAQGDYNKLENFNEYVEQKTKTENTFKEFVASDIKTNTINLSKIHFAMNGQWSDGLGHIHQIKDAKKLGKWLRGALNHIKEQLSYVE